MKFERIFNKIIVFLLTIAAGIVLVTSIKTNIYYDMHEDVDFPHYIDENYLALLISLFIVFVVYIILYKKRAFENSLLMNGLAVGFAVSYCLLLICVIKPLPVDDASLLDDVIRQFMEGNYKSLTDKGGYLYIWPFQLGYVLFGQTMTNLFGAGNYFAWDIVQLVSIVITLVMLMLITWELFESKVICGIMAFMSMGMLFFYNYVTFVYGDILSMGPQTIALYLIVLFMKRERPIYALLSAPFIAAAVVIKPNCEITLIALIMGIFFARLSPDKTQSLIQKLIISAFIIAMVFGAKWAVNQHYCQLVGIEKIPGGSPSVSHIVMGLSESELEDGWYNAYNYNVFGANGFDTEATRQAATEDLKERLNTFVHHPRYAFKFFLRKYMTQWADSVCISTHNLDLVSRHVENQPPLCDYIVFGDGGKALAWVMNVFMTFCYLGVVVYLINRLIRGNIYKEEMLLLILIFGGIVFHEFWEGSSRYAMRYYVYWIPYAAWGIEAIIGKLVKN